jgi:hypothetical protein
MDHNGFLSYRDLKGLKRASVHASVEIPDEPVIQTSLVAGNDRPWGPG